MKSGLFCLSSLKLNHTSTWQCTMYIPWEFPLRMHRPKLVMKNDPYQQTPHSLVFQLEGLVCKYHKPRQLKKKKNSKACHLFCCMLPLEICWKTRFEACRVVFWSLSCYKELKLTTKPFTGCTVRSLLIQMQNISLWSLGMHRKQNFESSKFLLSLLPSFFLSYLPHFFFSCWAFSRLHFGGKSF